MKMNENILKRVRAVEEKNGIKYAKTDGKLYSVLKVLYTVVLVYAVGINLIYCLGMLIVRPEDGIYVVAAAVGTVLMIAGYVLNHFKFKLASGIISVLPELALIYTFGTLLKDSLGLFGFKYSFYYRHLIPLLILAALMIWMTVIFLRERIKTEKQYNKVSENLYARFNMSVGGDGAEVTDEQWNEFINSYDPANYSKLFK